jgi:hypothetical protein
MVQVAVSPDFQKTDKRRYSCPRGMCSKTFSTSGHASRHAKTHEGKKEHICIECHKRFGRRDNMKQHMTTHKRRKGGEPLTLSRDDSPVAGSLPARSSLQSQRPALATMRQPSAMDLLAAAAAAQQLDD